MAKLLAWLKRYKFWLLGAAGAFLVLLFVPVVVVRVATAAYRYSAMEQGWQERVPERGVAIVLGAGVLPDGTPTPYLKMRIRTAAELYQAGKVQKILMSGDNRGSHYNEPVVMGKYAQRLGVPKDAIVLDYGGYNTYDTCYRAKHIFGLNAAVVVTQSYHLPRARRCHVQQPWHAEHRRGGYAHWPGLYRHIHITGGALDQ